jgi:chaperonin GroEL (HSP60 family)
MKNLVTNVVPEPLLRQAQLRALKLFSDVVGCTYGPLGGKTGYSKTDGTTKAVVSNYSKDGFTILKNIETDQPIESLLREEIRDICTQVIKVVGDGTSSAVLLSYQIFKGMLWLNKYKKHRKRDIIKSFKECVKEISDSINAKARPATLDDIYNIALTSLNGNTEMAETIKKIYNDYGMNVFIDVQGSNSPETIVKGYDGMIYDSGYLDPCFVNTEGSFVCDLPDARVYVFESPVDTPAMIDTFHLIVSKELEEPISKMRKLVAEKKWDKIPHATRQNLMPKPTIIFAPYFSRDANSYLDQIISTYTSIPIGQRGNFCIVQMGNGDPNKLIDIMKMTGARFIKKYIDPEQFKADQMQGLAPTPTNITSFAGFAERVVIDKLSTKIVNPQNMRDEDGKLTTFFTNYVDELKDQVEKLEITRADIVEIGKLKRRINVLLGNMVDLYIGGIGTSDRQSLTDAVEDAVLNCRSAAEDGVGNGASYDGLVASSELYLSVINRLKILKEGGREPTTYAKVYLDVAALLHFAYLTNMTKIYEAYYENKCEALSSVIDLLSSDTKVPFNIITEQYDGTVLTSIKTEPAILDSIARIISVLFDTNQFLVPTPQFNIYTEDKLVIDGTKTPEEIEKDEYRDLEMFYESHASYLDGKKEENKLGYSFSWLRN